MHVHRSASFMIVAGALALGCPSDGGRETDAASSGMSPSTSFGESTGETTASQPTSSSATGAVTETGTTSEGSSATSASTGEEPTTGDESTTGGPAMSEDEILLRKAIAGEVDAGEAMQTIADRGGFPVAAASGGYMFACLCGQGDWNLAGDHNAWAPEPMTPAGALWWIEAEVATPDGSLYKFHEPGSMQWITDPYGRRHRYDENGVSSIVRATAPHLERWYAIDGADLGLPARDLEVLVPQDGVFTHALYAHDGQNLFDPMAIWGGWKLLDSAPPDMLIVGINNTPARMEEYTPVPDTLDGQMVGGQAAAYAELLETRIRPRMEAAYGPADVVGTMGSSLGGLVSLVIADLYPETYDMAISMSGTLGWGSIEQHNETILETYQMAGKRDFAIYVDSGGDGMCVDADADGIEDDDANSFDNYCTNLQMVGILEGVGYAQDVDLFYVHAPGAMHNEAEWAARVGVPLQIFAGL